MNSLPDELRSRFPDLAADWLSTAFRPPHRSSWSAPCALSVSVFALRAPKSGVNGAATGGAGVESCLLAGQCTRECAALRSDASAAAYPFSEAVPCGAFASSPAIHCPPLRPGRLPASLASLAAVGRPGPPPPSQARPPPAWALVRCQHCRRVVLASVAEAHAVECAERVRRWASSKEASSSRGNAGCEANGGSGPGGGSAGADAADGRAEGAPGGLPRSRHRGGGTLGRHRSEKHRGSLEGPRAVPLFELSIPLASSPPPFGVSSAPRGRSRSPPAVPRPLRRSRSEQPVRRPRRVFSLHELGAAGGPALGPAFGAAREAALTSSFGVARGTAPTGRDTAVQRMAPGVPASSGETLRGASASAAMRRLAAERTVRVPVWGPVGGGRAGRPPPAIEVEAEAAVPRLDRTHSVPTPQADGNVAEKRREDVGKDADACADADGYRPDRDQSVTESTPARTSCLVPPAHQRGAISAASSASLRHPPRVSQPLEHPTRVAVRQAAWELQEAQRAAVAAPPGLSRDVAIRAAGHAHARLRAALARSKAEVVGCAASVSAGGRAGGSSATDNDCRALPPQHQPTRLAPSAQLQPMLPVHPTRSGQMAQLQPMQMMQAVHSTQTAQLQPMQSSLQASHVPFDSAPLVLHGSPSNGGALTPFAALPGHQVALPLQSAPPQGYLSYQGLVTPYVAHPPGQPSCVAAHLQPHPYTHMQTPIVCADQPVALHRSASESAAQFIAQFAPSQHMPHYDAAGSAPVAPRYAAAISSQTAPCYASAGSAPIASWDGAGSSAAPSYSSASYAVASSTLTAPPYASTSPFASATQPSPACASSPTRADHPRSVPHPPGSLYAAAPAHPYACSLPLPHSAPFGSSPSSQPRPHAQGYAALPSGQPFGVQAHAGADTHGAGPFPAAASQWPGTSTGSSGQWPGGGAWQGEGATPEWATSGALEGGTLGGWMGPGAGAPPSFAPAAPMRLPQDALAHSYAKGV